MTCDCGGTKDRAHKLYCPEYRVKRRSNTPGPEKDRQQFVFDLESGQIYRPKVGRWKQLVAESKILRKYL